ncbi:MAG TPA: lysophospholipid acyltransferase family protein [Byssovorax sp.]
MTLVPREPTPPLELLMDAMSAFRSKGKSRARPDDLGARDPEFIARVMPLMGLFYDDYFRCETEFEADPPAGAFLAVGNHNGMTGTPDMFCHMVAFWRRYGVARRSYGLMHDMPFHVPLAGAWLNASGAVRACRDNARRALDEGAAVLVFPGGDVDSCKPFSKRYSIEFGARRGFVRTAIRAGVPIVPIVSAGGHQSLYIWTDGRRLAKLLRLPEIARSNVAPIGFALPWGLIVGVPYPHLPPPVKIHTRILPAIHLDLPPDAADDPQTVERVFVRVTTAMQEALDDLRAAGRHGLFPRRKSRTGRLLPG